MPAGAGREGAIAAGLARDDRIRWCMRLADLERHLRKHGYVFLGKVALTPSGSTPHAAKSPACRVTKRSRKGRFALFAGSLKYLSPELLQGTSVVSVC